MRILAGTAVCFGFAAITPSWANDVPIFEIAIKNHKFEPVTLEVPANKKLRLIVKNQDPTAEEFESYELNREKVVPANSQGVVFIGPLDAGTYPFFGDFNQATAQGKIVAK